MNVVVRVALRDYYPTEQILPTMESVLLGVHCSIVRLTSVGPNHPTILVQNSNHVVVNRVPQSPDAVLEIVPVFADSVGNNSSHPRNPTPHLAN